MTHRVIWTPPGHFAPEHADHPTAEAAHAHALQVSRECGCEVAVVEVEVEG